MLRGLETESHSGRDMSRRVRIAGIQYAACGDRDQNIKRALAFTHAALEKNTQLVVYPECFTLPWFHDTNPDDYRKLAEPIPGPSTEPFLKLSQEYPAVFLCPVFQVRNTRYFFSTACIQNGHVLGIYHKVHLASADGWNEQALAEPGQNIPLFVTDYATVGIAMGWDVFFPEAISSMALRGADIIVAPTAAALGSKFRWLSVLASHAVCNNLFVIRINRCGTEHDLSFYGESFCVDPFGSLIDEPTFHRDSLMIIDLNLSDIAASKKEFPFLDQRRPDLYRLPESPDNERKQKDDV
jgi:N-carbamoylputrescine amidase